MKAKIREPIVQPYWSRVLRFLRYSIGILQQEKISLPCDWKPIEIEFKDFESRETDMVIVGQGSVDAPERNEMKGLLNRFILGDWRTCIVLETVLPVKRWFLAFAVLAENQVQWCEVCTIPLGEWRVKALIGPGPVVFFGLSDKGEILQLHQVKTMKRNIWGRPYYYNPLL